MEKVPAEIWNGILEKGQHMQRQDIHDQLYFTETQ